LDVHPNQITHWKAQLHEGTNEVFVSAAGAASNTPSVDVKSLHAKTGELTLQRASSVGFFRRGLQNQ